jgi:hypothetical protein
VGAPTIISNITPRTHNRDADYCFLSEEWNPVQKKPQQILVLCTFLAPLHIRVCWCPCDSLASRKLSTYGSNFKIIIHTAILCVHAMSGKWVPVLKETAPASSEEN